MLSVLTSGDTPLWQMSVERYHAMIDRGILGPDDPVELLEGVLVQKMPKNPPHTIANRKSQEALQRAIPPGWWVRVQDPITLTDSEPEPDLAIVRGHWDDYAGGHPGPPNVGLVIEIADATLVRDTVLKRHIYATAGIPWYWVVDLNNRRVEVYSQPVGTDYLRHTTHGLQDSIAVILDGQLVGEIPVSDLLP